MGDASALSRQPSRRQSMLLALSVGLAGLALVSLCVGEARLALTQIFEALFTRQGVAAVIVYEIRLPRTLLALMVGAVLGLSGAALQGLLRNPLAEASVFGAPQSAAFGAVAVLYTGLVGAVSWLLPVAAMVMAMASLWLLVWLAGQRAQVLVLLLAGLAVGTLAGAATSVLISLSPNPFAVTEIVFWLMGSFENRSLQHVLLAAPFILLAFGLMLRQGNAYRALSLGEETAVSLGVDVEAVRRDTLWAVALGVGASVAVAGAIGFIGLAAPQLMRRFCAQDPKQILLPSALAGAVLLLLADLAVRLVPAQNEIKVGAVTALLGVPLYLAALRRETSVRGLA
jgi:iron complex transport system permease protein